MLCTGRVATVPLKPNQLVATRTHDWTGPSMIGPPRLLIPRGIGKSFQLVSDARWYLVRQIAIKVDASSTTMRSGAVQLLRFAVF